MKCHLNVTMSSDAILVTWKKQAFKEGGNEHKVGNIDH